MRVNVAGTWMAHPRLHSALDAVSASPTARGVLEEGAKLRTRLRFQDPPASINDIVNDRAAGTYRPFTNTLEMDPAVGLPNGIRVPLDDGRFFTQRAAGPLDDGLTLVHETMHRLQNRGGIPRALVVEFSDTFTAPLAGARQLLHPAPGESRRTAFMRGFDRHLAKPEIDAYRVEDKARTELGQKPLYHTADGRYPGDDAILKDIRDDYVPRLRKQWALGAGWVGLAGPYLGYEYLVKDRL